MSDEFRLERNDLNRLIDDLKTCGFAIIAPTLKDDAIIYDEIESVENLPIGWTAKQQAGKYKIEKRDDEALFGFNLAANSWKRFLHPPEHKLFSATKTANGFEIDEDNKDTPKYALLGVKPCELEAIKIQDKVFLDGKYIDQEYYSRRKKSLIITVNCGQAESTCFCTSMGGSPESKSGYDILLTEIINKKEHYFIVNSGSDAGRDIIDKLSCKEATNIELDMASESIGKAEKQMQSYIVEMSDAKELLLRNYDNEQWDKIADKCLTCGNCTMACPTCFCTTIEDINDLTGDHTERWQKWDSCFTMDFSYIHGGDVRSSAKSRYRQWMTHKLSTWHDQFNSSGCVGCGNCITWCPVEIDIREEVQAIRESEKNE